MNPLAHDSISPLRAAAGLAAALCLGACGSTEPDPTPAALDRVWQATQEGVEEVTIELDADGSARVVDADYTDRSCASSSGVWTSDGSRVVLRLTPPGGAPESDVRSFDYEVSEDSLVLTGGGASTTYVPTGDVPSCVSYGFGSWQGTLSAEVDGVAETYTNFAVTADPLDAGRIEVLACPDTVTTCALADAMLVLRVNAPSPPLAPGGYPLGDTENGFYALINPFPSDPAFPGFDTLRLTPPGAFLLTSVSEEWVVGTFEFRANERANNSPPAPDGRTFVQVTNGLVNLAYR